MEEMSAEVEQANNGSSNNGIEDVVVRRQQSSSGMMGALVEFIGICTDFTGFTAEL